MDFKKIVENLQDGVVVFNKEGNVIYHNKSFEQLWGVYQEAIKNYNIFNDKALISNRLIDQIKQVFKGKPFMYVEGYYDSLLEQSKGYTIWVETNLFPLFNNEGEVEQVVFVHKDISEVKLAQEEIRIAKSETAEANRLKNAFLANLSHEIRTPLNAVIGFGDLIYDTLKDSNTETDLHLLNNFLEGIRRLHRTLTQILEISQIDTGNYQIKIEPVNLKDEIITILNEFKIELEKKKLEIQLTLDEKHQMVLADKPAIRRILQNLFENAVKFTNKGYIKIETYVNKNENILFCAIKDTGIGISEDYLEHIFEPFSQEEDGFKRPFEGSGLGLALTKRYLDLINSSITVDSVKGVGSTFTFTLPVFRN